MNTQKKLEYVLKGIMVLAFIGLTYVVFDLIEFCSDCEPMIALEECTVHPVYNCHQSKYQHWTDMNKRRDGE